MSWMRLNEALAQLPALLIRGKFSFTFDEVPFLSDRLSFSQRMNLLKAGVDELLGTNRMRALPPTIQIEPTNLCTLKCPLCPTGRGTPKRGRGSMSMETFSKIMDELGDVLIAVYLYSWGEPFLNEELPRMIEMCTVRNILTEVSTNGHCLQTLDEALRVVDSGLTAILVAIDGSTQEIYQAYRKSGDIEKVKRCVALVEEAKAKRGSRYPYTNLRFIVTRDNEDDLPNVERLARELGVDMFSYRSLGMMPEAEKYGDYEPAEKSLRRYEYEGASRRRLPPFQCRFPFRQPTVFWDGTVVGCEYDYELELPWGRIGDRSFAEMWNSPRAVECRRMIRHGPGRPRFCDSCPYRDRHSASCVLSSIELRSPGAAK